jgi:hypothetical protein
MPLKHNTCFVIDLIFFKEFHQMLMTSYGIFYVVQFFYLSQFVKRTAFFQYRYLLKTAHNKAIIKIIKTKAQPGNGGSYL